MKPVAKCVGENGNVFNIVGICARALKRANQNEKVVEMQNRVFASGSYKEALAIMMEYVDME